MYINVSFYAFEDAFRHAGRGDQFTPTAQRALFDYLEQLEDDTGQKMELDVIALCCDYAEMTDEEFRESYPDEQPENCQHIIARLDNGSLLIRNF
jgi:hypothetical protein